MSSPARPSRSAWRERLYVVIFESDTPLGKAFDMLLIGAIALSVVAVSLESVRGVREVYGDELRVLEWIFTLLFTAEYVLRLICARKPWKYATSFFGVIDVLAVIPTYLSLFIPGAQHLIAVRILRTLRVFRVLKLAEYLQEANVLIRALKASQRKITVFLMAVLTLVVILGSVMYLIEGAENGFTSIPLSIYWAIVTLTTVGYGDISPQTIPGQAFAALIMVVGYGIIAVPTGIVTAEIARANRGASSSVPPRCPECRLTDHDDDAVFCKRCGTALPDETSPGAQTPPTPNAPPVRASDGASEK